MLKYCFVKKFQLIVIQKIKKFAQRKIYELIEKKNQNQIKIFFIWIFKYKFDTNDYFIKFKTRLCVKKNLQTTYENTYATILIAKIFKIVMIIAVAFDMKIHQFDAINAFVNNKFDEEILCKCSEKFRQSNKCWKLFRTLYDLKQISMLWYKKFISILKNLNLMSVFEINCLYANDWLILFFYVDDIIVLSIKQNVDKFQIFEKTLLMKFQMRIFEKLNWFLNIKIIRNRKSRKIWLCQNSYIEKITIKFNVENFKNIIIFLTEIFKNNDDEIFVIDQTIYEY